MVGAMKPSLHFHTGQIVLYEGRSDGALVNLADRLSFETRRGWKGRPLTDPEASETVLMVIDRGTALQKHWLDLEPERLATYGIYDVWRLDRHRLDQRAAQLRAEGVDPDWRDPRPERF